MEDNQHRLRPACVPAPGMGQSELAAAAVERQSWPAHHATDLEGMSTATSPGLSMLSTLSDSVGGSPVPASPAALWAEARLQQQQQQQQQLCELPEAEPVTPSADMRQYLYWQSLQQQQQQLVSTAQYPPDGSSTASSAQMPQHMQQQEAESVLRSLPQHTLAMSHGTGSHPAGPHSPMCAELLHAGQYAGQPSTSRSHDNLRALQLPNLGAGSPAHGSARQPALPGSPQHEAGTSRNTAQCATYHTPALPPSTEAHPAQLGNHHAISDDYSSSSSRFSTVSSLAATSRSSPARLALASLAGGRAEPDLQAAAAAAAAAATVPQTSSLAAAGGTAEGQFSQGRLQQLAVPSDRAPDSTAGSGWQQLALRMMAVTAAERQSEQAADTGPGPSDTLHAHSCHTGGQGFMPRVPVRQPPHAAAAAAAASTQAAQASYVGSLEPPQPWPAPAAADVGLASAHVATAGSSMHHWDASITQHPAVGLASPHLPAASPPAAARATGRPAVADVPPAQQALAVAGMPPHFAQLSAAGAQTSPSQPQQEGVAAGRWGSSPAHAALPSEAHYHSAALAGGETVWLHDGVQGMQRAAAATTMPAAADAAYTHAAMPAWMHQTVADAGPGHGYSSRRSSTQDAAATMYYALAASAAQLQGSPAAMPDSLNISAGWGAAVQPAAAPAQQQPLWQGVHAPISMLQREPTFTPAAADAMPASAQTAQAAAATASAAASGGLPGWQQLAASTVHPPSRISPQPGAIMQAMQEAVGPTTGTGPSRGSAGAGEHAQLAGVAQGFAGAGFPAAEPSSYGHPGFSAAQAEEAFCSAGQPAASRYTVPFSRGPPPGSHPLQTPMVAPVGLQGAALSAGPGRATGGLVWPAGTPGLPPAGLGGPAAMLLHQQQQQQGTSTYGQLGGASPGYTQVHSRPGGLTGFEPAGLAHQAAAAAGFQDTTAPWHSMGPGQQQQHLQQQQQQQAATAAHPLLQPALPQLLQPALGASAGPGPLLLTQQQQLEQLIRMQQLQLLQLQLQVQAVAGATAAHSNPTALFGAALQPSALQAAALWSHTGLLGPMSAQPLFPGGLHPALQHPAQVAAALQPLPQALRLATALAASGAPAGQLVGLQLTGAGALAASQPADGGAGQSSSTSPGDMGHAFPSRAASGSGVITSESSAVAASQRYGITAWLHSLWMAVPGSSASSISAAQQEAAVAAGLSRTCTGTVPATVPALTASASSTVPDTPAEAGTTTLFVPSAAAAAFSLAGSGWAVGTAVLQVAVLPWQGVWFLSRTAVSASAWAAHSAALVCVRASQYQLLLLLFWLTLVAAAAQAAGAAAAAAWITTSLLLRLADREARIFLCAASVVALTDLKQLCVLLATQPLSLVQVKAAQLHGWGSSTLLLQANPQAQTDTAALAAAMAVSQVGPSATVGGAAPGHTAASQSITSSRANSAAAPRSERETGRSGSISLSHVLGGFLGLPLYSRQSSQRLTPGSSASNSRRSSGQGGPAQASIASAAAAVGTAGGTLQQETSSSQLIVRPDSAAAAAVLTPFAAQTQQLGASSSSVAEGPVQAAAPATWLAGPTVLLFDSLAVVSGLWAGLCFRLWVLLAVQAPTAGCRIWLHAAKSGYWMSAAAAATSTRTALQVAWHLAHISLMLLQGAAAAGMSRPLTEHQPTGASAGLKLSQGTGRQQGLAGWAAAGTFRWVGAAVCGALQWWWLAVANPFSSFWQLLMPVCMHWAGSSPANSMSTFFLKMPNSLGVWAVYAFTAATSAARSPRAWASSLRQGLTLLSQAGLRAVAAKGMQSAGLLVLWLGSWIMGVLERLVVVAVEWLLRDVPPVARAALCGSARMIRGLVVEAGRQSALLAAQLITAWQAHQADA